MGNSYTIYGYKVNISDIDLYDEKFSRWIVGKEYRLIQINPTEAIIGLVLYNPNISIDNCIEIKIPSRDVECQIYDDVRGLFGVNNFCDYCRLYSVVEWVD